MKINITLFFSVILISCSSIPDDPDLQTSETAEAKLSSLLIDADKVMSLPISSPEGKLKMVKNYISTNHFYYPTNEESFYSVLVDEKLDTVMITLTYLNNKQTQDVKSIFYENGIAYRWSAFEYKYNSEGLLDEIYSSNSTMERALLAKYHYDSENLLVEIAYPYADGEELQVYEYDESNRISSEWKSVRGQENSKIDYLVYRYDNGLLAAKESGVSGTIGEDRQDAFQYFYDFQGKLVQAKEFDPYFGFQHKNTLEYSYYGENN